jgi:hypothetical protein
MKKATKQLSIQRNDLVYATDILGNYGPFIINNRARFNEEKNEWQFNASSFGQEGKRFTTGIYTSQVDRVCQHFEYFILERIQFGLSPLTEEEIEELKNAK